MIFSTGQFLVVFFQMFLLLDIKMVVFIFLMSGLCDVLEVD